MAGTGWIVLGPGPGEEEERTKPTAESFSCTLPSKWLSLSPWCVGCWSSCTTSTVSSVRGSKNGSCVLWRRSNICFFCWCDLCFFFVFFFSLRHYCYILPGICLCTVQLPRCSDGANWLRHCEVWASLFQKNIKNIFLHNPNSQTDSVTSSQTHTDVYQYYLIVAQNNWIRVNISTFPGFSINTVTFSPSEQGIVVTVGRYETRPVCYFLLPTCLPLNHPGWQTSLNCWKPLFILSSVLFFFQLLCPKLELLGEVSHTGFCVH